MRYFLITLVYESKEPSPLFENQMREISGVEEIQCICVFDIFSAKAFNKSLEQASYDTVVFLREGVFICSENWGRKILKTFATSSHGIIGTLGTLIVPMSGILWEKEEPLCGSIWYKKYKPKYKNTFGEKFEGKVLDVVTLEGSFMAIHKQRIAESFDEKFRGNSFYDTDFCIQNYKKGIKIGVISGIDILKENFDEQDDDFLINHKMFISKHKDLPLRIVPEVFINKEEVKLDAFPSINIVIANKGDIFDLITSTESIYRESSYPNYKITVVDFGSSEEEIRELSAYVKGRKNISYIQKTHSHLPVIYNEQAQENQADLILFMSKHVVFQNDAISLMVKTYLKDPKGCGTIGIRSHQKSHMVRQMGLELFTYETDEGFELGLNMKGYGKAYGYQNKIIKGVMGNSLECLLVEREVFLNLGGFNQNYFHSLEDFELNLKMILENRKNFLIGTAVAIYHGIDKPKFILQDYTILMDFINKNIDLISPYVSLITHLTQK
jgi:hypothetical protein